MQAPRSEDLQVARGFQATPESAVMSMAPTAGIRCHHYQFAAGCEQTVAFHQKTARVSEMFDHVSHVNRVETLRRKSELATIAPVAGEVSRPRFRHACRVKFDSGNSPSARSHFIEHRSGTGS